jgi:hypothetical protein
MARGELFNRSSATLLLLYAQSEPPANLNEPPRHTRTPNLYSSTLLYVPKKAGTPTDLKNLSKRMNGDVLHKTVTQCTDLNLLIFLHGMAKKVSILELKQFCLKYAQ